MADVRADAPGRVNLIGEHTDYQEGFVMPSAVPQRTHATLRPRSDRLVRAASEEMDDGEVTYELGRETRRGTWIDYVQGVTWELARRGVRLHGFDLAVRSTVPVGSGLSSSAALEVAVLRAIRLAFGLTLSDVALALAAQRAEVDFVGAPVGIMDQMASSLADERHALFIDTRTLAFEAIALPTALELVVIDSGVAHRHAGGEYATRRRESEEAAQLLGVAALRDAAIDAVSRLPDTLARRARHIISENGRVLAARRALLDADLGTLGRLFRESHASLRDDYQVSIPEVDLLVDLACAHRDVFGARMTGGGFGGAIVIAAKAATGRTVADSVRREYARRAGREATMLVPCP